MSLEDFLKSTNISLFPVSTYSTIMFVFLIRNYTVINTQVTKKNKRWEHGLSKVADAVWYPPLAMQHTSVHSSSEALVGLTNCHLHQASFEDPTESDRKNSLITLLSFTDSPRLQSLCVRCCRVMKYEIYPCTRCYSTHIYSI